MNFFGFLVGHWLIHQLTDDKYETPIYTYTTNREPTYELFTLTDKNKKEIFKINLNFKEEIVFKIETSGQKVEYTLCNSENYKKFENNKEWTSWAGETNNGIAKVIIPNTDTYYFIIYKKEINETIGVGTYLCYKGTLQNLIYTKKE